MNAHARFVEAVTRLATAPSIVRTRREDVERRKAHGGVNGELLARIESSTARAERLTRVVENEPV